MRKHLSIAALALSSVLALLFAQTAPASAAVAANLGFETGNVNGWTVSGDNASIQVLNHHQGETTNYTPQFGSFFLDLKGGCPANPTTASETFVLQAGRTLQGKAAFDAHDVMPFNDSASVTIYDKLGNIVAQPYKSDIATVGNNGDGAWIAWSFTAPATAEYVLQYASTNATDCAFSSDGLFDASGTTTTAAKLVPGLALSAKLVNDALQAVAGKTLRFTCTGCVDTAVTTDSSGTASIAALDDPTMYVAAVLAGGYCVEFYGDASANPSSGCATAT